MSGKNTNSSDTQLINSQAFENFISLYKFPLILAGTGFALLFLAIALLLKDQIKRNPSIVFDAESSASASMKIVVDVEGAVIEPGVYEFGQEDRVVEALAKAGGVSAEADRQWIAKNLNKAAKLADGGKIYIPSTVDKNQSYVNTQVKEQSVDSKTSSSNLLGVSEGKININSASKSELEEISGIGPVTAQKIIDSRPYNSVEELKDKKVLGQSLFEKSKDLLCVY